MKKIVLIACTVLFSISIIHAQQKKEENQTIESIHIDLKDGVQPDIYVDGKKFDFPMELLDKDRIESVNVIKGEKAMKEYNSKNGVVLVTTKKSSGKKIKLEIDGAADKEPMVIVDGEESDREILNKISPDDIEIIEVFKGEQAIKKYNAPNGVVVIITKKGKKK